MSILIVVMSVLAFATPLSGRTVQDGEVSRAFAYYETVRVALAADTMTDVPKHAAALAPLAEKIGGGTARQAAEGIAAAKDIKTARDHFGKLSVALLPAFEKARLSGVRFFTCPMVKQSWAQKGEEIENPYYGKSMLTCGVPKK